MADRHCLTGTAPVRAGPEPDRTESLAGAPPDTPARVAHGRSTLFDRDGASPRPPLPPYGNAATAVAAAYRRCRLCRLPRRSRPPPLPAEAAVAALWKCRHRRRRRVPPLPPVPPSPPIAPCPGSAGGPTCIAGGSGSGGAPCPDLSFAALPRCGFAAIARAARVDPPALRVVRGVAELLARTCRLPHYLDVACLAWRDRHPGSNALRALELRLADMETSCPSTTQLRVWRAWPGETDIRARTPCEPWNSVWPIWKRLARRRRAPAARWAASVTPGSAVPAVRVVSVVLVVQVRLRHRYRRAPAARWAASVTPGSAVPAVRVVSVVLVVQVRLR